MAEQILLNIALEAAKKAGQQVMQFYHSGDFTAETKDDDSPVTSADIAANDIIMAHLAEFTPDIPVISEEQSIRSWFEVTLLFIPFSYGPLGLCMLVASVFNALGVPRKALNVSFLRLFVFYIPALWLGSITGEMVNAVIAATVANVLAGAFAWFKLNAYIKTHIIPRAAAANKQRVLSAG